MSGTWRAPPASPAGSTPFAARPSTIDVLAWWASSAPSTLTPMAPPRLRKNAISELPEPMSRRATVFCTTSTRFCMTMPTPAPTMSMNTPGSTRFVRSSIVPMSASPIVSPSVPTSIGRF